MGILLWQTAITSIKHHRVVSANDNEMARVNEGRRVSSKSPSLARAVEEVMSKETDETRFKSFFKSWQLTLKLDSDHTCYFLPRRPVPTKGHASSAQPGPFCISSGLF